MSKNPCEGCAFIRRDGVCDNINCEEYGRQPLCDVLCQCHTPYTDGATACGECAFAKDGICQHRRCSLFGKPSDQNACLCFVDHSGRGGVAMSDIQVVGYVGECGYRGYIQPQDLGWILYIRDDGTPEFYASRDPETGAVLSPPATV